jgi:hypothetical protein
MVVSLKSLDRDVMVVCCEFSVSMVVRFLLESSRGVVGSSPLFWAGGICVCSCTMGGWASVALILAVRFGMLASAFSDGMERDALGAAKLPTWVLVLLVATSGGAGGSMGGTLGEKRETCGAVLALPAPSAGAPGAKDHVSSCRNAAVWTWRS